MSPPEVREEACQDVFRIQIGWVDVAKEIKVTDVETAVISDKKRRGQRGVVHETCPKFGKYGRGRQRRNLDALHLLSMPYRVDCPIAIVGAAHDNVANVE